MAPQLHAYAKVSEDEDVELDPPATRQNQGPSSSCMWSQETCSSRYLPTVRTLLLSSLGLTVFYLLLLVATQLWWGGSSPSSSSPSSKSRVDVPLRQCGGTPAEARRLGCRFEMHNFAWVPPACYDEALGAEWDSFPDWGFSRSRDDGGDTDADFVAQCRAGNVAQAWVPWWQHMAHCDLILKKYIRSVMYFRPMDNWTANWEHNEHCANMMTRYDVEPFFYNSLLHLKFPVCDYAWLDDSRDPAEHAPKHTWHPHAGSMHDDEHSH